MVTNLLFNCSEIIEFSLLDIRQNPDKANVHVENEESLTENEEKEEEVVGDHVSHTGSEGESVEQSNKESEAGGVESSNNESFEPEQEQFPSHLITGTQHPSSTVTVTLTQSEDSTFLPPPHLIGIMHKLLIELSK
jgi:hypothetical protein